MTNSKQLKTWEEVFDNPSDIKLKTFKTGYLIGSEKGMINMKSKDYEKKSSFKKAKLPVLSHLIYYGDKRYLVDTGFYSSFSVKWGGSFKGLIKSLYFRNKYFQENASIGIENQLINKGIKLDAIYLTHAHEHGVGVEALEENIPLRLGKGEKDISFFPFIYSKAIKSRKNIEYIDFSRLGVEMPLLGRCIDLFNDNSFWAIDTHGHTKGHISYLINGIERAVLLTGDAVNNGLSFSKGIEPGVYSEDSLESKKSFSKLKVFSDTYSNVEVIFGHEVKEMFDIQYEK